VSPDPDPAPVFQAQHLRKVYRTGEVEVVALRDVSLAIARGEFIVLLGPSGSGKSTLLNILGGLDVPTSGEVRFADHLLTGADEAALTRYRREHVGFVFQFYNLIPSLTVRENVALVTDIAEHPMDIDESRGLEGLQPRRDHFPAQLSGGEQQRVALARALAPRPRIMLMDEPFSGLDNRLRDGIRDTTLDVLKEEGTAVLLVTHEPDEAMRMADEIALMRGGRIVQRGAPYNVYNAPVDKEAAAFFSDINVIRAVSRGALTETPFGAFLTPGHADGAEVEIVIRPQHLKIDFDRGGRGPNPTPQDGTAARGRVIRSRFMGRESLVDFRMEFDGLKLTASVPGVFLPRPDTDLWLMIRRDRCYVFPASRAA
jgi:iron(III) transport system ATP-binding protein